jgi:hypothetical protein
MVAAGLLTVAVAAQTGVTPRSGSGTLTVYVPEGAIIQAWVYVDGKLLASPPDGDRQGVRARRNRCDGWELSDANGLTLTTHLGKYENLASYVKNASANGKSVFSARGKYLPAGRYTVEAAFLWQGTHCDQMHPHAAGFFPFVFSAKYTGTVIPGRKTEIYIAPPDGYDLGIPMMASPALRAAGCSLVKGGQPSEDSLDALENSVMKFERDPQVVALLRAARSHAAKPGNVVEIDLPADLGGRREFDGAQINYIVDFFVSGDPVWWAMPGHEEVATCRQRYPQFAKTFAEYDKLIDLVGGQAASIRKLQTSLNGNRQTADEPADEQ